MAMALLALLFKNRRGIATTNLGELFFQLFMPAREHPGLDALRCTSQSPEMRFPARILRHARCSKTCVTVRTTPLSTTNMLLDALV